MSKIIIHQGNIKDTKASIELCPFGAIEKMGKGLAINAGCKMCKICTKKAPDVFEFVEVALHNVNKDEWHGIAVYIDHVEGEVHPVSYELIGKALEMACKINHKVYAVLIGDNVGDAADEVLKFGVDAVYVYDDPTLKEFRIEPYTAAFEDFITNKQPSIVLVGGTTIGRSLAPRVAARFRTGLTADCTILDVQENTDLDQIRPAFGGNIMAHIHTPNHRPQFATVRYKIFNAPEKQIRTFREKVLCDVSGLDLSSAINVLEVHTKEKSETIEDAETIVVAGSAFKKKEDLEMVYELADKLDAKVACTRPLIEKGWMDPRLQIGLSGRTVKPKLIITCGVSGAIQFVAGMNGSDNIMAINADPKATIFNVAHYAIVGDVYEIIPKLLEKIECKSNNVKKEELVCQ